MSSTHWGSDGLALLFFFFFGSNLISFKIVIWVCILIESSINFVYGFDYLYEFVCGFDEFGSRFRTILMVLWCVHDDFGLGFSVSFDWFWVGFSNCFSVNFELIFCVKLRCLVVVLGLVVGWLFSTSFFLFCHAWLL